MKVTIDGHFVFDCDDELQSANRLVRAIHKDGFVNTSDPMWKAWCNSDFGKSSNFNHVTVLVWSTVFLQRLMFSLICFYEGVDP